MEQDHNIVQFIQKINDDEFLKLINAAIDHTVNSKSISEEFITKIAATKDAVDFLTRVIKNHYPKYDDSLTKQLDFLDSSKLIAVEKSIELRKCELDQHFINLSLPLFGPLVVDFDWKVKLALSSSSCAYLNQPLCELIFHVQDKTAGTNKTNTINLELDRTRLIEFIDKLESIHKNLEEKVNEK